MNAKFNNDEVGASAYGPRVMLKVVLLGYSQGLVSSRAIERACLHNVFTAKVADCQSCALRSLCRKSESSQRGKQVSRFEPKVRAPTDCSERLRRAIDSVRGRQLYSQRIGTVEPVFGNIRHNKGLARLNLRGREKVNAQWHLNCMVHNIEKLANSVWRQ